MITIQSNNIHNSFSLDTYYICLALDTLSLCARFMFTISGGFDIPRWPWALLFRVDPAGDRHQQCLTYKSRVEATSLTRCQTDHEKVDF